MVPKNLIGEMLIPLAELRLEFPDIFEREIKKYDDHPKRKLLPQRILKKLNCPQEAVLHFSPIHPHLMFNGLRSVFPEWDYSQKFFEIPISRIENKHSIIFDMNCTGHYTFGEDEPDEMFSWVTPENYKILDALPSQAIDFYKEWKDRGERGAPAMARIPHLMTKGRVSIADCRVIDWKDQPK